MVKEENLPIIIIIALTGFIIVPMFFLGNGLLYIIRVINKQTNEEFLWFTFAITTLLFLGSLVGIFIGEWVFNRVAALKITLIINAIVAGIIFALIIILPKFVWLCYFVYAVTVGMIGPILISFIADQYDMFIEYDPLLYFNICYSYLLGSMFLLYTLRSMTNPAILLIFSIICLLIALFGLIMISTRFKKHFIIKQKSKGLADKPSKPEMIELLKLFVPAAALLVIINILGNDFQVWSKENFSYNRSFDEAVLILQGYAGVFLIPVIILLGIKSFPKLYVMLAWLSILIAALIWPLVAKTCVLKPDLTNFGPEVITVTLFNQRECDTHFENEPKNFYRKTRIKAFTFHRETRLRPNSTSHPATFAYYGMYPEDPREQFDFQTNCANDVNYIIKSHYDSYTAYDPYGSKRRCDPCKERGLAISCVRHRRHVSGYPTLGIVRGNRLNITIRLVHIKTNSTIEFKHFDPIHILQLLPGKWSIYVAVFHKDLHRNYTLTYDYKPGGFYYQQVLVQCTSFTTHYAYIEVPKTILLPYQCNLNTNPFYPMYWLLMFGKILIVTSTFVICSFNLEINMKCFSVGGCFIFFHLSHMISSMLAIFKIKSNHHLIKLFLLIIFLLFFPYFTNLESEQSEKDISEKPAHEEYPVQQTKSDELGSHASRRSIAKPSKKHAKLN